MEPRTGGNNPVVPRPRQFDTLSSVKEHYLRSTLAVFLSSILLVFSSGLVSAADTTATDLPSVEENEIVGKYLNASRVQEESLRGLKMDVEISAKLPKQ